ncbi:hypothetical protein CALVIDRAFT_409972 [Calocera viscosa TUFC12733]|uniref:Uncharacterized protein n=1 Tax=Calocera viscosa (strain TUFC12733) TaxID=1330018 RepID=A0A167G8F6_CALVF|nr:hypothetical protein CALVIDRAFT_409972 [Calocera viscosa TUFC12733]
MRAGTLETLHSRWDCASAGLLWVSASLLRSWGRHNGWWAACATMSSLIHPLTVRLHDWLTQWSPHGVDKLSGLRRACLYQNSSSSIMLSKSSLPLIAVAFFNILVPRGCTGAM